MSWDQRFFDPIILEGREPLVTLRDAAHYITKLPKAEHDAEEWQAAMLFARIGVMKALNRNFERTLTDRKEMHWGKRKLKLKRDE